MRSVGIAGSTPTPRSEFAQIGIKAPTVPSGLGASCEQLKIRPLAKRLDARVDLVWFPAVLAPRRDDQLADICRETVRVAARREQTRFGVGARPKSEPGKEITVVIEGLGLSQLCPIETDGLVSEAPGSDHLEGLFEQRIGRPEKQDAVICGPLGDR